MSTPLPPDPDRPNLAGSTPPPGAQPPLPTPVTPGLPSDIPPRYAGGPPAPLPPVLPPAPRRGPLGLAWPWWIAGGCLVLLLLGCLCVALVALLAAVGQRTPSQRSTPAVVVSEPAAPSSPAPIQDEAAPSGGLGNNPIDAVAPDFSLTTLDGRTVRLGELRGHPVILNFWASWCGPCLAEMPLLSRTYTENQANGLVLVAVDVQEKPSDVQRYLNNHQLPFEVILDSSASVAAQYHVRAFPTTYFIGPDGVIRSWQIGTLSETALSRHLDRIR